MKACGSPRHWARPLASQMSGGEQQMLALARTNLMIGPRLLLLDETCEGIAQVLVAAMLAAATGL